MAALSLRAIAALSLALLAGCAGRDAEEARKAALDPRTSRLASIPAATFAYREPQEINAKSVSVAAFRIEVTEVTVAAFRECVKARGCAQPEVVPEKLCNWWLPGRDDHPMNCVTPPEAEAYCRWNGGRRLPTPHELYWAALGREAMSQANRGDINRHPRYPWGQTATEKVPHCWKRGSFTAPRGGAVGPMETAPPPVASDLGSCPVASYPDDRSAFGLYDTVGNVGELVFNPKPKTCVSLAGEGPCPREHHFAAQGGTWQSNETIGAQSPDAEWAIGLSPREPALGFRCVEGGSAR